MDAVIAKIEGAFAQFPQERATMEDMGRVAKVGVSAGRAPAMVLCPSSRSAPAAVPAAAPAAGRLTHSQALAGAVTPRGNAGAHVTAQTLRWGRRARTPGPGTLPSRQGVLGRVNTAPRPHVGF